VTVVLTTPCVHEVATLPPLLDVATERSYDGEISVKAPPVEDESVTTTLVAFTCSASAAELVATVRVVAGETIDIDSAVAKLSGAAKAVCAASAIQITPRRRTKSENGCCLVNEVNTDVVGGCYFQKSIVLRPGAALGEIVPPASLALLTDAIGPEE